MFPQWPQQWRNIGTCTSRTDQKTQVWLNYHGLANVLSVPQLKKEGFMVLFTMGSHCHVYPPNSDTPIICSCDTGVAEDIPYMDLQDEGTNALLVVQILCHHYKGFTDQDVRDDRRARDVMAMIVHPSSQEFDNIVSNSTNLHNFNVKPEQANNAKYIFGPPITGVRGKTIRLKPAYVDTYLVPILQDFYILYLYITLTVGMMFVNGLPMLVTCSQRIRMLTVEYITSHMPENLAHHLNKVINVYHHGGFKMNTILMDMEFEPLSALLETMDCNMTAVREHIGEIESKIRTIKE